MSHNLNHVLWGKEHSCLTGIWGPDLGSGKGSSGKSYLMWDLQDVHDVIRQKGKEIRRADFRKRDLIAGTKALEGEENTTQSRKSLLQEQKRWMRTGDRQESGRCWASRLRSWIIKNRKSLYSRRWHFCLYYFEEILESQEDVKTEEFISTLNPASPNKSILHTYRILIKLRKWLSGL